jgi:hypothetical protein
VSGTSPRPIRELYAQMKAIDPKAYVVKTEFPVTEWPTPTGTNGSATAHNAVLSRLSQAPPYYSKGDFSLITFGIASNSTLKQNVYQWMLSNPKGSIYQDPTNYYVGPLYDSVMFPKPTPIPAPTASVYFKNFIDTRPVFGVTWSDGTQTVWRLPAGATIKEVYTNGDAKASGQYLKITYSTGSKVFGPKK